MNISQNKDKDVLKIEFANEFNCLLSKKKDFPHLILLSGGSSLELVNSIDTKYLGINTTVAPLDERFSTDRKENNFLQITSLKPFNDNAKLAGINYISTIPEKNEILSDFTTRLTIKFTKWLEEYPHGEIIATLGIGPDGHIAGIMPCPENPKFFNEHFETNVLFTGYDATLNKNAFPLRFTPTITFLKSKINYAFVYVTGENKKKIFENVLAADGKLNELPAKVIKDMKNVKIFTDIETIKD